jgi:Reverse transcriptase (RNA-dependent DNA polymerase)
MHLAVSTSFSSQCAIFNFIALTTDAVNAFANAPAPKNSTNVYVDDAYIDWYSSRFGITLDRNMVLPANHALQGHPESPRLWEKHINDILITKLGLHTTTHERSIYSGNYNNHHILIKRQVDNLAVAAPTIEIEKSIIQEIGKYIKLDGEDILIKFNGVEVDQTQNYILLHCASYIKIVTNNGWDTIQSNDSTILEPLPESLIKQIDIDTGPSEHSVEARAIEIQAGFNYRQVALTLDTSSQN